MDERDERKQKSPSLPPNYVSFAQLRDQWLQKQKQQENQQNQEKAVSENDTQITIGDSDSKKKKKNRYPERKNHKHTTPNDYEKSSSSTSIQPQKNSNEKTSIDESSGGGGVIYKEKVLPKNGLKEGFRKAGGLLRNRCNDSNNKEYRVKLHLERNVVEKKMEVEEKEKDNVGKKLVLKGKELEINSKNEASDIDENANKGEIGKGFRRYGNMRRPSVRRNSGQLRERMDRSKYQNLEKVNGGMGLGLKVNEMEINSKDKADIEEVSSKIDGLKGIGKNDQNHTVQVKGLSDDTTESSTMRIEFAVAEDNEKNGETLNEFSSRNGRNHTVQEEKGLSDDTTKSSMFAVVDDNAKKGEIKYKFKSKNGQNRTVQGEGLSEDTTESSMKRNEVVWVEKNTKKSEIENEFRTPYGNMRTPYVRSFGQFGGRMGRSNYSNHARFGGSRKDSGSGKVWVKKEEKSCANSAEIASSSGISQAQD